MACNSKMVGRRTKRTEIWESRVVVTCVWGTFDLLVFKVSFGLIIKWSYSLTLYCTGARALRWMMDGWMGLLSIDCFTCYSEKVSLHCTS